MWSPLQYSVQFWLPNFKDIVEQEKVQKEVATKLNTGL